MLTLARFLASCVGEEGLSCLSMATVLLGSPREMLDLREKHQPSVRGLTPSQLRAAAETIGLRATEVDGIERLLSARGPVVLRWDRSSYVLLDGRTGSRRRRLFDPVTGWRRTSEDELRRRFGGSAYELGLSELVGKRQPRTTRVEIADLLPTDRGVYAVAGQVLALSIALQTYMIASPLYMRLVLDTIVAKKSTDLLLMAGCGFALLAIFNAIGSGLRASVALTLSNRLSTLLTARVLNHLLRLPLIWFQARKLGDVLSRIQGVDQLRGALTAIVGSVMDVALTVFALSMLMLVSPPMLIIAGIGFTLQVALRLCALPIGIGLNNASIMASASEQGKRIETMRSIQTIKALDAEKERETDWFEHFLAALGSAKKSGVFAAIFSGGQSLVGNLTMILALYIGARFVAAGTMTVGTLIAALAYLGQLSQGLSSLFQQYFSWRMLGLQLDRLSEIMLEPAAAEKGLTDVAALRSPASLDFEAKDVRFRFSPADPLLFDDLALRVVPGEFVAIIGPSGVGKSTLIKVLSGLYAASSGTIALNGYPIDRWRLAGQPGLIGLVLQDDHLLAGSILENVTVFARQPDEEWAWKCLSLVGMEDSVAQLPLGVDTLVGDVGVSLSGGQCQRLLIARALYRRPKLLMLDEATAHLDDETESVVLRSLDDLAITRIVVAHKEQTIRAADRVFELYQGRLVERSPVSRAQLPA